MYSPFIGFNTVYPPFTIHYVGHLPSSGFPLSHRQCLPIYPLFLSFSFFFFHWRDSLEANSPKPVPGAGLFICKPLKKIKAHSMNLLLILIHLLNLSSSKKYLRHSQMFPAEFSEETSDLPCGIQICGYETAERAEPFCFPRVCMHTPRQTWRDKVSGPHVCQINS